MKRLFGLALVSLILLQCTPRWVAETAPEDEGMTPARLEKLESSPGEASIRNREVYERLKAEIRRFWGAPYVWGGASPQGTDCSGLIKTVFKRAADIKLPHSVREIFKKGKPISVKELQMGDLVFFNDGYSRVPTHAGIYIDNGMFVHASVSKGVTLSSLLKPPYNRQFIGARRILD